MNISISDSPRLSPPSTVKKVVVVDDSRAIRAWLRLVLEADSRLEVVGEAQDAAEAREVIKRTNPDVITLDIEMPGMNGLEFLEKLMTLRPTPVVMISGTTQRNSESTIKALAFGAVDCIQKPVGPADPHTHRGITRRVFSAACSTVQPLRKAPLMAGPKRPSYDTTPSPLILIGASTGGVAALETLLSGLDPLDPPVVIVQHMPGAFLVSFSQHLNARLPQDIQLAKAGEVLQAGMVRIAPAMGKHTMVRRSKGEWRCSFSDLDEDALYCPSVEHLFGSARNVASDVIAVILTGLGRDGAHAMLDLRRAGARTIGQDAASCVVYGMPRVAFELGAVEVQADIGRISGLIRDAAQDHAIFKKAR